MANKSLCDFDVAGDILLSAGGNSTTASITNSGHYVIFYANDSDANLPYFFMGNRSQDMNFYVNSAGNYWREIDSTVMASLTAGQFTVAGEVEATSLDINGEANISDHLVVKGTTSQPLSSLFAGSLVVQGGNDEDPLIAVTDVNEANAAAGVFHQSSASPGFPALVINAHSNGSEQPLISARTNVNNSTGVGGTEVFAVDGDGDATFAGAIGSGAITSTGKITGTELEGTSLDINGNADISGNLTGVDTLTATTLSVTNYGLASGDIPNNAADTTGNAATATQATNLNATDDRDMAPEDYSYSNDFRVFFTSKEGLEDGTSVGSNWMDAIYLNTWNDATGHDANVLAFDKSTKAIYHYQADQAATNWGTAKQLAYTDSDVSGNTTGTAAGLSATLAIASGGTAAVNSNGWLNSRITTSADGSLNYDATSAVAVNHDSLAGFVAAEHINWAASDAGTIHASNYIENVVGNLGVTANATSLTVTTTNGTNIAIPAATGSAQGVMTPELIAAISANSDKETNESEPDAEEGTKGVVEIADLTEAIAGEEAVVKAVTPFLVSKAIESRKVHELAAPTSALAMNSQKITGITDPTAAQDAATKAYVDAKTWNWNDITAGTVPTFNQNTTGSARTLATTRAIYGNNFDGSAAVTGTIATAYIADDAITEDKLANTLLAEIDANTTKNTAPSVYGDYIKLLPNDFETNGDGGNTKFGAAFDKTAGQADYGMRTSASNQEMFAFVNIPQGYKATKVEVYGRRAKVVEVFEVQINATTVVSKGTGNCWIPSQTLGDEDITLSGGGVTSTATNLLMIEVVTTAATGDRMYGGRVLIEAI